MSAVALTIPGIEGGAWQVRHRFDGAACALADRHYSRERPSNQIGGPGFILVLVTPCERAVWVSKRHAPETRSARSVADGLDAYRCQTFRNEGAGVASELILAAVELTERLWGPPPPDGWATYVDASRVASPNPGYCFKMAGWQVDRGYEHPVLVRLRPQPALAS